MAQAYIRPFVARSGTAGKLQRVVRASSSTRPPDAAHPPRRRQQRSASVAVPLLSPLCSAARSPPPPTASLSLPRQQYTRLPRTWHDGQIARQRQHHQLFVVGVTEVQAGGGVDNCRIPEHQQHLARQLLAGIAARTAIVEPGVSTPSLKASWKSKTPGSLFAAPSPP